jgi:hypothetical protein
LISQLTNLSEIRDKNIFEIDEIIDHIKKNRKTSVEEKGEALIGEGSPDVISQFRTLIQRMMLSNNQLQMVINRLNELA